MRNSLAFAPMPTASTSQILGNNECFEAFTSNLYVRRTLSGEFIVLNKHLVRDLIAEDLWSLNMKDEILRHKGSIQAIQGIPEHIGNSTRPPGKSSNATCLTWLLTVVHTLTKANR